MGLATLLSPGMMGGDGKVRIDKWLWAARMFKTRSMASDACTGGHVKLNDETVSQQERHDRRHCGCPHPGGPRVLEVAGLADKRGPAKVAVTLYVDHTPPPPPTGPMAGDPTFDRGSRRGRKGARPTKRDRRRFNPDKGW